LQKEIYLKNDPSPSHFWAFSRLLLTLSGRHSSLLKLVRHAGISTVDFA